MEQQKYVAYYRISVQKKDKDGNKVEKKDDLSLEWQQRECDRYVNSKDGVIIGEFKEIASGRNDNRSEVAKAIKICQENDAILVIAKFSRFMRSLSFLVMIREAKIKFVAVDFEAANEFMVSMLCVVYEYQAKEIGKFVKDTLSIAREKRGEWRVSNFNDSGRRKAAQTKLKKWSDPKYKMLKQFCESLKGQGMTYHEIAWKVRQSAFSPILPNATADKIGALLRREIAA